MKIQVIAEREQKIQTEVKEIRKVFYCELCNKQYKLAVEFEAHLSSYDHNHRKVNGPSLRKDERNYGQVLFCYIWYRLYMNACSNSCSVLRK